MPVFVTYKRWSLKDGRRESDLLKLVREEFQPHYAKLNGCLGLGLLHIDGTRSYLTQQFWESRKRWHATTSSDDYQAWWQEYVPLLERWDEIMEFEDEWEAEDLLGTGGGP
ncbi:MAG: antibiotic biosynthesis monooxygenase [Chloroflexi bacterium]|nr:antibiotic biosynthesis monooxygenase [Chloroflexota bacterium]